MHIFKSKGLVRTVVLFILPFVVGIFVRVILTKQITGVYNDQPFTIISQSPAVSEIAIVVLLMLLYLISNISKGICEYAMILLVGASSANVCEFFIYRNIFDYLPGVWGRTSNISDYIIIISLIILAVMIWRKPAVIS